MPISVSITTFPKVPQAVHPDNPTREEWENLARAFYRFDYTYYEKSDAEHKWCTEERQWLKDHIPDEYKEGVHLLHQGGGFMGEDVFVVDGEIDHCLHLNCKVCGSYQVLSRDGRSENGRLKVWCVPCESYTEV